MVPLAAIIAGLEDDETGEEASLIEIEADLRARRLRTDVWYDPAYIRSYATKPIMAYRWRLFRENTVLAEGYYELKRGLLGLLVAYVDGDTHSQAYGSALRDLREVLRQQPLSISLGKGG